MGKHKTAVVVLNSSIVSTPVRTQNYMGIGRVKNSVPQVVWYPGLPTGCTGSPVSLEYTATTEGLMFGLVTRKESSRAIIGDPSKPPKLKQKQGRSVFRAA